MVPIAKCLTLLVAVVTVVINTLESNKRPFDS